MDKQWAPTPLGFAKLTSLIAPSLTIGLPPGCGITASMAYDYFLLMDKNNEIEIPLPRGGTLTLRSVSAADEEFLLSLYASTRAEELAQAEWQEGQQYAFVKWQFDLQRREYGARFPDAEYNLILIDNTPAGRIWIGSDAEQIRLLDIALLPEFQNRGCGTLLLRRLMSESERAGKPLRHMVFVLNNDAHRFYERLGFKIIEDLGAYKHMEFTPE